MYKDCPKVINSQLIIIILRIQNIEHFLKIKTFTSLVLDYMGCLKITDSSLAVPQIC